MSLENILITGASGLVGLPLVKKLLNNSNLVIGIDPVLNQVKSQNYRHFKNTFSNIDDIFSLLKEYRITKIIHAGGVSGPMLLNQNPDLIIENNVNFTMRLVEASRIYKKINRFIFCSSISAYGNLDINNITESYRFAPENLYGATKAACDLLLKRYFLEYGLDIISLRLSTIYGHQRSTSCFINDIIVSTLKNKKLKLPFRSDLRWPYIYVEDVTSSIEKCLFFNKEHFFDYNVSGPDFPSYENIIEEINLYFDNNRVAFSDHNEFSERKLFSIKKIKKDINWEPKYSIKKGIKDYISKLNRN
tara:strand:- start:547 stop:1458 length:912 start_codon:yes stop_codon:yes gene_type:complete